jgi:hypothetical protein
MIAPAGHRRGRRADAATGEATSRAEIARFSGLARSTVAALVADRSKLLSVDRPAG